MAGLTRRSVLAGVGGLTAVAASMSVAAPRARSGIIDVHAHLSIAAYLSLLASGGIVSPGYSRTSGPAPTVSAVLSDAPSAMVQRLALMDRAGVARQMLSPSLAPHSADEVLALRAASLVNNRHAALKRDYPGRFGALAALPLPHVDAALSELRRALDGLGLDGISLHASVLETSIADPRFDALFAELDQRRSVVLIHPSVTGLGAPLINDWRLQTSLGPLLEDAVVAVQLIASNIPVRFPGIRIIVPHLGGGLATMLDRLDNQLPLAVPRLAGRPSEMAKRLWYDTVSHGSVPALRAAVQAFGADRIVPGSDFPVLLAFGPYARTFGYVREALTDDAATTILHRNAAALFGRA